MGNRALIVSALVLSFSIVSYGQKPGQVGSGKSAATTVALISDAVLVGAGDIASCDDLAGAKATEKLIDEIPGTVFAAATGRSSAFARNLTHETSSI
jgi:hypothetical protein